MSDLLKRSVTNSSFLQVYGRQNSDEVLNNPNIRRVGLVSEGYNSYDEWKIHPTSPISKKGFTMFESPQNIKQLHSPDTKSESETRKRGILMINQTNYAEQSDEEGKEEKSISSPADQEFDLAMYKLTKLFNTVETKDNNLPQKTEEKMLNSIDKREYGYTGGLNLKEYLPGHVPLTSSVLETPSQANAKKISGDSYWNSVAPSLKSDTQKSLSFKQRTAILVEEQQLKDEQYKPSFESPEISQERKLTAMDILNDASIKSVEESKKSMSKKEWNSLVERLSKVSDKKIRKMEEIAKRKEEQLTEETTFTPYINPRSRNIASSYSSLSERVDSFLEDKKQNIERKKKQLEAVEMKDTTFKPKLSSKTKSISRDVDNLIDWKKQRNERLEEMRTNTISEELEKCTFKPDVSTRTKKIMEKIKAKAGCNVFDRNYNFEFVKQARSEKRLREAYIKDKPLNPEITDLASHLHRPEPVGDRLYRLAMKSIQDKDERRRRRYEQLLKRNNSDERFSHLSENNSEYSLGDSEFEYSLLSYIQQENRIPMYYREEYGNDQDDQRNDSKSLRYLNNSDLDYEDPSDEPIEEQDYPHKSDRDGTKEGYLTPSTSSSISLVSHSYYSDEDDE